VWNDRIFLTSAVGSLGNDEGSDLLLICASTAGKELWRKSVADKNKNARAGEGNSASPSPATDGEHVWVFFGTGVLGCYDFEGNEVWKFNVQDRYGKFDIQFGMTSTPVLDGDGLYLQLIHGTWGGPYKVGKVIKLNKRTGAEVWAVDRPSDADAECKHSYASAIMYRDGDEKFLITHGADCTVAYDPDTGKEIGRLGGLNGPSKFNGKYDQTLRMVATPSFAPGVVVVPTAKGGPVVAVNVSDELQGDLTNVPGAVRWFTDKTPDVSIPLIVDGLVYFLDKPGAFWCVDLETGKELYRQRLHSAEHRSSPTYADGHVYCCAKDGNCTVVKAGREFAVVAKNELGGEAITATPVVSNGTLYLRTYEALYAIRK
jgi:outer membrane protein assembly factor BamB